jgi:predicted small secreted protein
MGFSIFIRGEITMKRTLIAVIVSAVITGCSTIGGAVKGVGEDVKRGTDYVSDILLPTNRK